MTDYDLIKEYLLKEIEKGESIASMQGIQTNALPHRSASQLIDILKGCHARGWIKTV